MHYVNRFLYALNKHKDNTPINKHISINYFKTEKEKERCRWNLKIEFPNRSLCSMSLRRFPLSNILYCISKRIIYYWTRSDLGSFDRGGVILVRNMAEENQHIIFANSDNDEKKIIRREVEKQRRSQMSILCASLRSSLPFELIKVFFNLTSIFFSFITNITLLIN